ncbi:MAG TPA: sulfotransferase [Steroidobacteraceae bacterium]|nr:sulfotransferase [Steroidobacteraceae bacterium]
MFNWLKGGEATAAGTALADDFVLRARPGSGAHARGNHSATQDKDLQKFLQKFLQRVDQDVRPMHLNVFKRARLANSFKWRLLEKGVEREVVDELTQALVLRLSASPPGATQSDRSVPAGSGQPHARKRETLLGEGDAAMARADHAGAAHSYRELLTLDPRHAVAHNNLGAALFSLGQYSQAEAEFRQAIGVRPGYPDAHCNLGQVLQVTGQIAESEAPLRRAVKLKPSYVNAQVILGSTLVRLRRLADARDLFEKALRLEPRNTYALVGLGGIAGFEGRFDEAETLYKRALDVDKNMSGAWLGLVRLRRMTSADSAWLKGAEEAAASGRGALEETNIRYAIGKYYDDVGNFGRAFRSYQRANELQKTLARPYDREARSHFVDDVMRVYTRETVERGYAGASDSAQPVLVVGMMRSGTSLVEQIIAAHPAAYGAGELEFWNDAVRKDAATIRDGSSSEALRQKLATAYLRTLATRAPGAARIIDKATINSDYLGFIHTVFPRARMIYLRRDPIDTCLSCYFQPLSPELSFAMDLDDLAHYAREHQRLAAHWRSVLPRETLLEVPYAELITAQEPWTRRIVEFLGLPWDEQCLEYYRANRNVVTASYWQVRQKLYQTSVGRWRKYEQFIGPLRDLRERDS